MPSPTTGSFTMLPPLTDEGSMITSIKHKQVDVPTASDFTASFNFKNQDNFDVDSLSPYFASLNQVPLYILIVIKKKTKGCIVFFTFYHGYVNIFLYRTVNAWCYCINYMLCVVNRRLLKIAICSNCNMLSVVVI